MTTTPTYTVTLRVPGFYFTPAAWRVTSRTQIPADGRPTEANLARYVDSFEASTRLGGANAHLGATRVARAFITDQRTGHKVAEYTAPMFEVV